MKKHINTLLRGFKKHNIDVYEHKEREDGINIVYASFGMLALDYKNKSATVSFYVASHPDVAANLMLMLLDSKSGISDVSVMDSFYIELGGIIYHGDEAFKKFERGISEEISAITSHQLSMNNMLEQVDINRIPKA